MDYSTKEFLNALKESEMTVSSKLIRDSLLNGTYPGKQALTEATAEIVKIELVKEPYGMGVSVKQADNHEYRYAADDTHPKYDTPEKLEAAAQKLLKFRPSGAVLGWLSQNAILYYGSKRGANAEFPKTNESVSLNVMEDLCEMVKELHPDFSDKDVQEAAEAFLEEFGIKNDNDYYRIGPMRLRKAL